MIVSSSYFSIIPHIFAQHMMMPPAANIGDRKVALNFQTEPAVIKSGQNVLMKVAFLDQSTKQSIKHVTVRMDVISNKDGKNVLSEYSLLSCQKNTLAPVVVLELAIANFGDKLVVDAIRATMVS